MRLKGALLAPLMIFVTVVVGRSLLGGAEEQAADAGSPIETKDQCLSATAERQARCTSPGCEQLVFARMHQCLDETDGEKEQFCDNAQVWWLDSEGRDIFEAHCSLHSPYESECQKMIGQVGAWCARLI